MYKTKQSTFAYKELGLPKMLAVVQLDSIYKAVPQRQRIKSRLMFSSTCSPASCSPLSSEMGFCVRLADD